MRKYNLNTKYFFPFVDFCHILGLSSLNNPAKLAAGIEQALHFDWVLVLVLVGKYSISREIQNCIGVKNLTYISSEVLFISKPINWRPPSSHHLCWGLRSGGLPCGRQHPLGPWHQKSKWTNSYVITANCRNVQISLEANNELASHVSTTVSRSVG